MESMLVHNRQLHGDNLPAPSFAHRLQHLHPAGAGVGLGMIDLIDDDHARQVHLRGEVPYLICHRFDAALCVDHDHRRLRRQHRSAPLVNKHMEAGSVEQAHLRAAPFGEGNRVGHGHPAGDLLFVVCRHGGAILKTRGRCGHLGCLQNCGNQTGLSTMRVSDHRNIPKFTSSVGPHPALLLHAVACRPRLYPSGRRTRILPPERRKTLSRSPF